MVRIPPFLVPFPTPHTVTASPPVAHAAPTLLPPPRPPRALAMFLNYESVWPYFSINFLNLHPATHPPPASNLQAHPP